MAMHRGPRYCIYACK